MRPTCSGRHARSSANNEAHNEASQQVPPNDLSWLPWLLDSRRNKASQTPPLIEEHEPVTEMQATAPPWFCACPHKSKELGTNRCVRGCLIDSLRTSKVKGHSWPPTGGSLTCMASSQICHPSSSKICPGVTTHTYSTTKENLELLTGVWHW